MLWILIVICLAVNISHDEAADVKVPTIRSLHISSDIKNRYATTRIYSVYYNPSNQSSNASFIVTLPDKAFVSYFAIVKNGTQFLSQIKKNEQSPTGPVEPAGRVVLDARHVNQFAVTVSMEAQGNVTFNLTYDQLLTRSLGVYTNAISISPLQIVEDLSVTVSIEEQSDITFLEVSELQVPWSISSRRVALAQIKDVSPQLKEITWAATIGQQKELGSQGFQGQLVIQYDILRNQNPLQSLLEGEYFCIVFVPDGLPLLKKHIVFVLDYSGSMLGLKMNQLREAMAKMLSILNPIDYFSIVIFHDLMKVWSLNGWLTPESINGTTNGNGSIVLSSSENIILAINAIKNYNKTGGTNIFGALQTGLELVNISSSLWKNNGTNSPMPLIFFLTDGLPTDGMTNTNWIVGNITTLNIWSCPIYSLGFGYDADLNFLRKLSLSNYGFARPIFVASDASDQLTDFYQTIDSPLLLNITFKFTSTQVNSSTTTTVNFPVYNRGSEIVVCGTIIDGIKESITCEVTGLAGNQIQKWEITIFNPSGNRMRRSLSKSYGALEESWAYLSIQQNLDKALILNDGDEKTQALERGTDLSVQYSFDTNVTSLFIKKPNQNQETTVDVVSVKAGNWSFSQAKQISTTKNYTSSGGFITIPKLNVGCSIIIGILFYFVTYF